MRGAGDRVPVDAILREDARLQERLDQPHDASVSDASTHTLQQGGVVDVVEARFDVCFQHPLVAVAGEHVHLSDGVMRTSARTEAVRTRLEVRLEDGLEHEFQGRLHHPVTGGRDSQPTLLAARLGDHPFTHRQRLERAGLEIGPQSVQERCCTALLLDVAGRFAIYTGRACALVAPDPVPRNREKRRVIDEVVQVIEPTTILGCGLPLSVRNEDRR